MNRRDVIILATVVNAVLLLVLFSTAKRSSKPCEYPIAALPMKVMEAPAKDPQAPSHKVEGPLRGTDIKVHAPVPSGTRHASSAQLSAARLGEQPVAPMPSSSNMEASQQTSGAQSSAVPVGKKHNGATTNPTVAASLPQEQENHTNKNVEPAATPASPQYVSVVVKKGDFLERIAKANNTSVAKLMQINDLSSTQLKIGQVIKVPVAENIAKNPQVKVSNPDDYYVVKEGDSPWGIALRNGIRLQDLLQMNDLDEQKARKLRPGDRLRIR